MMEIRAPGPHKTPGVKSRRFLNQASGAPFDCQAISSSPRQTSSVGGASRPPKPYAAIDILVAANRSPRRSTAQAILASLLAKATIATLL